MLRTRKGILLVVTLIAASALVVLIFIGVKILGTALSGFGSAISSSEWVTPQSREAVETVGHFKIPTSAQDVRIYSESSLNDRFIYVSFEISPSELESFLATTYVGDLGVSSPPSEFYSLPLELNWKIDTEKEHLSGRGNGPQVTSQAVIVDNSDGGYVVYLVVFL